MPIIIGIHGKKHSGKTTATGIIREFLSTQSSSTRNVYEFAFADVLKDILCMLFGFSREYIEKNKETEIQSLGQKTIRDLMCLLGTFLRSIDEDILLHCVQRKIEGPEGGFAENDFIIITDIRLDSEADFVRQRLKGLIIKIDATTRLCGTIVAADDVTEQGISDKYVD